VCARGIAREKSVARLNGERTRMRVTWLSMSPNGMENSSSMQREMASQEVLAPAVLSSKRNA
jgi:hypothetical protein